MLVDSHCHLDHFGDDLDAVVERAEEAGVETIVTICTRLDRVEVAQTASERHQSVYYAVGLHPNHVEETQIPSVEDLVAQAQHPRMVGIGESGIDYFRSAGSADRQQESLRVHVEAARATDLPLIIHARDADEDVGQILAESYGKAPFRCVMHCFSSGADLAQQALEMGFYLSMAGNSTFKKAQPLRDVFASAPIDRILVETDSPYLAPEPCRGKRNEPALVRHTARMGAELFGLGEEEFARRTTDNFHRLFSKTKRRAQEDA